MYYSRFEKKIAVSESSRDKSPPMGNRRVGSKHKNNSGPFTLTVRHAMNWLNERRLLFIWREQVCFRLLCHFHFGVRRVHARRIDDARHAHSQLGLKSNVNNNNNRTKVNDNVTTVTTVLLAIELWKANELANGPTHANRDVCVHSFERWLWFRMCPSISVGFIACFDRQIEKVNNLLPYGPRMLNALGLQVPMVDDAKCCH